MKEMVQVFKSEIYKMLIRKKWIFTLLMLCLIPVFGVVFSILHKLFGWFQLSTALDACLVIDKMLCPLIISSFVAGRISEDYTSEAMKQVVSSGISRPTYMIGQWLAQTFLFAVFAIVGGLVFGTVGLALGGLGEGSVLRTLFTVGGEILYIAAIVAFIHLLMQLTKISIGPVIAFSAIVFTISGLFIGTGLRLIHLGFLEPYYFTIVLNHATNTEVSVMVQMLNMGGTICYTVLSLLIAIIVFNRKEL